MFRIIVCFFIFSLPSCLVAQNFNGYIHSDFSGIIGSRLQPASIAGSPYKYDFSLTNANFYIGNNVFYLVEGEEGKGVARYLDYQQKFLESNVSLGAISGMVSLPGNEALGFTYRMRAHGSAIDFSPEFLIQFGRFRAQDFQGTEAMDQSGKFAMALWREFGLTYAKIVADDGFNRWKVGGTLKLINSRGSAFFDVKDIDYTVDASGLVDVTSMNLALGYSSNLNGFEQFDGAEPLNRLPDFVGNRLGLDIGVVYERVAFREAPKDENGTKYTPDIDYEFKLSASITDIGKMHFEYGSASYLTTGLQPNISVNNLDTLFSGIGSFRGFTDSLSTLATLEPLQGEYIVRLPTALNLGYDYNFGNNYYIGANAQIDLTSLFPADYRLKYFHSITLNPRWEKGIKGLYLPLYFNQIGDFHVGLAGRYGPLTLGTHSLGGLLGKEPSAGGFFFSININQLKANSKKPYCFGPSKGTAMTNTKRTPIYKRKKWIFF